MLRWWEWACRQRVRGNLVAGACFGFSGDVGSQWLEHRGQLAERFDRRRCLALTLHTSLYLGGICTYVYAAYPFLAARVFPKARAQLREGVVATAVDNLVHVPTVYLPGYFMFVNGVEGKAVSEAMEIMRRDFFNAWSTCCMIWVPFQFVNFAILPPSLRVRAVTAMNCAWTMWLDNLSHR